MKSYERSLIEPTTTEAITTFNDLSNELFKDTYVFDFLDKETIRTNQAKAMVVVNSAMIMTYYEIGTIINKRKVWGNKYIERLSNDLKEYGKGYSSRNLRFMSTFAKKFSKDEICAATCCTNSLVYTL